MSMDRLTKAEARAISALQRLARSWPSTLTLFSWSGSLHVLKPAPGRTMASASVARITGITNDGGDPGINDALWKGSRI